jgi:hypothetical protein
VKANSNLTFESRELSFDAFWLSAKEEDPAISEIAIRIMIPCWTTYLYELRVSMLKEKPQRGD